MRTSGRGRLRESESVWRLSDHRVMESCDLYFMVKRSRRREDGG